MGWLVKNVAILVGFQGAKFRLPATTNSEKREISFFGKYLLTFGKKKGEAGVGQTRNMFPGSLTDAIER